jgi:hypothetical protein
MRKWSRFISKYCAGIRLDILRETTERKICGVAGLRTGFLPSTGCHELREILMAVQFNLKAGEEGLIYARK